MCCINDNQEFEKLKLYFIATRKDKPQMQINIIWLIILITSITLINASFLYFLNIDIKKETIVSFERQDLTPIITKIGSDNQKTRSVCYKMLKELRDGCD